MNYFDNQYEERRQSKARYDRQERALREAGTTRLEEEHRMHVAHSKGRLYTMVHERSEIYDERASE